jgi:tellurite resistance protein TerC
MRLISIGASIVVQLLPNRTQDFALPSASQFELAVSRAKDYGAFLAVRSLHALEGPEEPGYEPTLDPPGETFDPHEPEGLPNNYKLVKEKDYDSWYVFFLVFTLLLLFDNFVLMRTDEPIAFGRAVLYSIFWILCAALFCVYVYFARSPEDAYQWWVGYLLEWMLSVDNLFVFQSIFKVMGTPDEQKHKPLYWGIIGAEVFRMGFFVLESMLLYSFFWAHFVLGLFLIYTGIKVLQVEEEEDAATFTDNPCVKGFLWFFPFVDAYAPTAKFFARVPTNRRTKQPIIPSDWIIPSKSELDSRATSTNRPPTPREDSRPAGSAVRQEDSGGRVVRQESGDVGVVHRLYATRLFLVVVILEGTDILFAVDSVSAIVAQIPDLFLAYTACVFAMLGLRATFFVVDELVKIFFLLSYAVAGILIFLGVKLLLKTWLHIPARIVCAVLVSALLGSVLLSVLHRRLYPDSEEDGNESGSDFLDATSQPESPTSIRPSTLPSNPGLLDEHAVALRRSEADRQPRARRHEQEHPRGMSATRQD